MNEQKYLRAFKAITKDLPRDVIIQRLTSGGDHPRLVEEPSGAGGQPGATLSGHSLRVGETEDGVKLQQIVDYHKRQSVDFTEKALDLRSRGDMARSGMAQIAADSHAEWWCFLSAILSESPDESVAGEDEMCRRCGGRGWKTKQGKYGAYPLACTSCDGTGSRRKRSGLHNDQCPSAGDTK